MHIFHRLLAVSLLVALITACGGSSTSTSTSTLKAKALKPAESTQLLQD